MIRTFADRTRAASETSYLSDGGKKIVASNCLYKRTIPREEYEGKGYADLAELAVIFNHEVVEDKHGTWRWRANLMTSWLADHGPFYTPSSLSDIADGKSPYSRHSKENRGSLSMNNLWEDFHNGMFTLEEFMKFYMQIGYSLSGYCEVFGQREAAEFKLPDAKTPEGEDRYTETLIDYVVRIHKGKVLSL